jgi:DNA modification methylase
MAGTFRIGDALTLARELPDDSVDCIVTSPPYWGLRSYLADDDPDKAKEMGAEPTLAEYVERLVALFRELRRALKPEGVAWLNLGDCYASSPPGNKTLGVSAKSGLNGAKDPDGKYRQTLAAGHGTKSDTTKGSGLKPKDLCLVPYRVALALQDDGWYLRSNIVWAKPNPMPESVTDRPTNSHEAVFLLTKSARYWYDADAVREASARPDLAEKGATRRMGPSDAGGANLRNDEGRTCVPYQSHRNLRNVWNIATKPYSGSHYAVMPPALVEPCIKAGCPAGGLVLDPFGGSGTVGMVAESLGRRWLMFDLDQRNADLMRERTAQRSLLGLIQMEGE